MEYEIEKKRHYPKWAPKIPQLIFAAGWIAAGAIGVSIYKNLPESEKPKNQTKKDLLIGVMVSGLLGTAWTLLPTVTHLVGGGGSD